MKNQWTFTAIDIPGCDWCYKDVNAMAFAENGTKWIATNFYLFQIAGTHQTVYHSSELMGMSDCDITGLVLDRTGNLWMATRGGLGKFDGQGWT
jgi:ligand-binding sensor domain-containing protein